MTALETTVVYAGRGSSHSWTWLADLFEANGIFNVRFLDSEGFVSSVSSGPTQSVVISGGDGYGIAESLGPKGFGRLREFVARGGHYTGICAGAYLPLHSSIEPFSAFNLSTTKIENISSGMDLSSPPDPKEAVPYGSCAIFHPVRGPLEIAEATGKVLTAPLFGGPVFKEPEEDTVLMRYRLFTPLTQFQVDIDEARSLMIRKPAAIMAAYGEGRLVLLGPHLEHPRYPGANERFLELLGLSRHSPMKGGGGRGVEASAKLRAAVSDLKVAIIGLENRSFTVGHKVWDGVRLLELVDAIERRSWTLDDGNAERIISALGRARELLITMEVGSDSDADEPVVLLVEAARACVDNHFAVLSQMVGADGGRPSGRPRQ